MLWRSHYVPLGLNGAGARSNPHTRGSYADDPGVHASLNTYLLLHACLACTDTLSLLPGIIASRFQLQNFREQLEQGTTDFATLCSRESHCSSASKGGDLGEFGPGQMQKVFEDAVYNLQVCARVRACMHVWCKFLLRSCVACSVHLRFCSCFAGGGAQFSRCVRQWHPFNSSNGLTFLL